MHEQVDVPLGATERWFAPQQAPADARLIEPRERGSDGWMQVSRGSAHGRMPVVREYLAAQALEIPQVRQVRLPAVIQGPLQRQPRTVVMRVQKLIDQLHQGFAHRPLGFEGGRSRSAGGCL